MTSLLNWWTYAAKSLAPHDRSDTAKVKNLFMADSRCQLLVAKTAFTIWANTLLRCCDAVVGEAKDNISFESFMYLCNALLFVSTELFPRGAMRRIAEKSSLVLHDETIRKAFSVDKPQKNSVKRLQFTQSVRRRQSGKCMDSQLPRSALGRVLLLLPVLRLLPFPFLANVGVLKVPCLPLNHRWEAF